MTFADNVKLVGAAVVAARILHLSSAVTFHRKTGFIIPANVFKKVSAFRQADGSWTDRRCDCNKPRNTCLLSVKLETDLLSS